MAHNQSIPAAMIKRMRELRIDVDLTASLLARANETGRSSLRSGGDSLQLPRVDDSDIIDRVNLERLHLEIDRNSCRQRLEELLPDCPINLDDIPSRDGRLYFDARQLERIGRLLYPLLSYGLLNGGAASSYTDIKRNRAFDSALFDQSREDFDSIADRIAHLPKGISPAFIHPDGSFGPSFLLLKMRSLLLDLFYCRRERSLAGLPAPLLPAFQMVSARTDDMLRQAYSEYRDDPALRDLIAATGDDVTRMVSANQPLVAAFTSRSTGERTEIFQRAGGKEAEPLPLPGGHGQNFAALRDVYRSLREGGKRFVYIGNVDNLSYLPDPIAVAWLALQRRSALFEFSPRTSVDVKGGILMRDSQGRLVCGEIGNAISVDEVDTLEKEGRPILFNCAIGLFDLDRLESRLPDIIENLPIRWSEQNKEAGVYSQAERNTWDVMGMMDDVSVFRVRKSERFLAAKLLIEMMVTSGKVDPSGNSSLASAGEVLQKGLNELLRGRYKYRCHRDRWTPIRVDEL